MRHGYNVAKVEWFDDFTPEEEISFLLQKRLEERMNDGTHHPSYNLECLLISPIQHLCPKK